MYKLTTTEFFPQGYLSAEVTDVVVRVQAAVREAKRGLVEDLLNSSLEGETAEELGERGHRLEGVSAIWVCPRCGTSLRSKFRRDGHYRRKLLTLQGEVTLRVPLIRCKCGGYIPASWRIVPARMRRWFDVKLDHMRRYLTGTSHRKAAELESGVTACQISHMGGWWELQAAGQAAAKVKGPVLHLVVVILDEMYVAVGGTKLPILLAMDLEGQILDFEGPTTRSVANWETLLYRLADRGITVERGLRGIVADGDASIRQAVINVWGPKIKIQSCLWHLLYGLRAEARKVYGERSKQVSEVVAQARRVLLHDLRTEESVRKAAAAMAEFNRRYEGQSFVNIVARGFAEATVYLHDTALPRTNGTAERTIKEIRRRVKVMDGFKSLKGAINFMAIFVQWHNWWVDNRRKTTRMSRPRNLKTCPAPS
jgi:transposase-like protein